MRDDYISVDDLHERVKTVDMEGVMNTLAEKLGRNPTVQEYYDFLFNTDEGRKKLWDAVTGGLMVEASQQFGIHAAGTLNEIDAAMARHPAGKKRQPKPVADICGGWVSENSNATCTLPKAHEGLCDNP